MKTSPTVPVTAFTRVTYYKFKGDPNPEIANPAGTQTPTMIYRQTPKTVFSFTFQPFTRENVRDKDKKGTETFGELSREYLMTETFN